jgi:hypothetical protein
MTIEIQYVQLCGRVLHCRGRKLVSVTIFPEITYFNIYQKFELKLYIKMQYIFNQLFYTDFMSRHFFHLFSIVSNMSTFYFKIDVSFNDI